MHTFKIARRASTITNDGAEVDPCIYIEGDVTVGDPCQADHEIVMPLSGNFDLFVEDGQVALIRGDYDDHTETSILHATTDGNWVEDEAAMGAGTDTGQIAIRGEGFEIIADTFAGDDMCHVVCETTSEGECLALVVDVRGMLGALLEGLA